MSRAACLKGIKNGRSTYGVTCEKWPYGKCGLALHTRSRRNLKTQPSPLILNLCLEKLGQGNRTFIVMSIVKMITPPLQRKAGVLKFLRFEDRFQKSSVFVTE